MKENEYELDGSEMVILRMIEEKYFSEGDYCSLDLLYTLEDTLKDKLLATTNEIDNLEFRKKEISRDIDNLEYNKLEFEHILETFEKYIKYIENNSIY